MPGSWKTHLCFILPVLTAGLCFLVLASLVNLPTSKIWRFQAGSIKKIAPILTAQTMQGQRLCLLGKHRAMALSRVNLWFHLDPASGGVEIALLRGSRPPRTEAEINQRILRREHVGFLRLKKVTVVTWRFAPLSLLEPQASELYLLIRPDGLNPTDKVSPIIDNYPGWRCSNSDLLERDGSGGLIRRDGSGHFLVELGFEASARPKLISTGFVFHFYGLLLIIAVFVFFTVATGRPLGRLHFPAPVVYKTWIYPNRKFLTILFACGYGFLLGFYSPPYQVAVESGQILSGVMSYPQLSPQIIYHLKAWNLTIQSAAVLLKLGLSEFLVSQIICGLIHALYCLVFALITFQFGAGPLLALAVPPLILFGGSLADNSYPLLFSPDTLTASSVWPQPC